MADASFAQLKAKLNVRTNDGNDVSFTSAEKDEFLNAAFQDPSVYIIDRDDTTTTSANAASYPVPDTLSKVTQISVDVNGDGFTMPLDRSTWKQVNGNIYFSYVQKGIPANKTMVMWGISKLTTSDLIPDSLQEYILHLARVEAYQYILAKLTTRFMTNDITTAECLAAISRHQNAADRLKSTFVATEASEI